MRSPFSSGGKYQKIVRIMAVIYGLVMVNVGALILYEKFGQAETVFDTRFKAGVLCLGIGLIVLFFTRRTKDRS